MTVPPIQLLHPDEIVDATQCWGCNRVWLPREWAGWYRVLRAEGRLRVSEGLCGQVGCPADEIASPAKKR